MAKYACPCCGYLTLDEEPGGTYRLCAVCYWEDDQIQFRDHDYEGGANEPSLNQARKNFEKFGACCKQDLPNVRAPNPDELPIK